MRDTKDEALDLALEALEWANNEINEWRHEAHGYKPEDQPAIMSAINVIKQARAAPVQEPLSFNCSAGCGACGVKLQDFVTHQTQAQEGDEWVVVDTEPQIVSTCCGSPVEVWDERKQNITASVDATPPNVATPLAAQPAPVQEPVAWMRKWAFDGEVPAKVKNDAGRWHWPTKFKLMPITENQCLMDDVPLYATPPAAQRQWVGLTDEEAHEAIGLAGVELLELAKMWSDNKIHVYQFDNGARKIIKAVLSRAIEAKLKEKNT